MRKRTTVAAVLAALAVSIGGGSAVAQAAEYEGTVTAKNASKRTFTLRDHDGRGTFTFKVTGSTSFERVAGFDGIRVGASGIEVIANKRVNGRLLAIEVERSGGGGGVDDDRGGDDRGGGSDDGPNHG